MDVVPARRFAVNRILEAIIKLHKADWTIIFIGDGFAILVCCVCIDGVDWWSVCEYLAEFRWEKGELVLQIFPSAKDSGKRKQDMLALVTFCCMRAVALGNFADEDCVDVAGGTGYAEGFSGTVDRSSTHAFDNEHPDRVRLWSVVRYGGMEELKEMKKAVT